MGASSRRVFVVAWMLLSLAGALNHTIAEKLLGRRLDLVLPHLQYGYVMFNLNPRTVQVLEYARADGVRHDLAELVPTPAPGYARARLAIDVATVPDYLMEVCYRASRARNEEFEFYVSTYQVDDGARLTSTDVWHCDDHGLVRR